MMCQALGQAQGPAVAGHVVIGALHGVDLHWPVVKWGLRLTKEVSCQAVKCH